MSDQDDIAEPGHKQTQLQVRPDEEFASPQADEELAFAQTSYDQPAIPAALGVEPTDGEDSPSHRENPVTSQELRAVHGSLADIDTGFVINGRYRVDQRLGMGGFAVVFKAFDEQIQRDVAVKVMNTENITGDESLRENFLERFHREAQLAARVRHPNVMSIFDFGVVEGFEEPFMVMELLEGFDLETELTERGGMNPQRVLPLFIDCLSALGVAHREGIVHKDLKPPNLFLRQPETRFEALIVVDFGIAHINESYRSRMTQVGQLMGTPGYISPEYATEQIVTPSLDVYQMGLILVEMLTGQPVVDHPDPVSAMFQHVRGELTLPQALLDSPLGPVLACALNCDYKSRYEDGLAFADALEAVSPDDVPTIEQDYEAVSLSKVAHTLCFVPDGEKEPDGEKAESDPQQVQEAEQDASGQRSSSTMFMFGDTTSELESKNSASADSAARGDHKPTTGAARNTPASVAKQQDAPQAAEAAKPAAEAKPAASFDAVKPAQAPAEKKARTKLDGRFSSPAAEDAPAYDADLEDYEQPSSKKGVIVAVLVLLVGGGAAFAFLGGLDLFGGSGEAAPADEVAAVDEAEPSTDDEQAAPEKEAVAPTAAEDDKDEKAAAVVNVMVQSEPSGSSVFDGDEKLGTTPFEVEFDDAQADKRQFRLRHSGYDSQNVTVAPDSGSEVAVKLERSKAPKKTAKPERASTSKPTAEKPEPSAEKPKPEQASEPTAEKPEPSAEKPKPASKPQKEAAPEKPAEEKASPKEENQDSQKIMLPDF